ncbi:MAG TPA: family 16 glycosylhydrolase [Pyrinomonadaceae bacterium]|nr:family 16 glycosylhydrolase [Pyrinomonadaceae bacterium]
MSLKQTLFPLTLVLIGLLLSAHLVGNGSASQASQQPAAWEVKIAANAQARSNVQVRNFCSGSHTFKAVPQDLPYLQLPTPPTATAPGRSVQNMPVTFNTAGMQPGQYEGVLNIMCVDCPAEPGCRQETERLTVRLTVLPAAATPTPTPKPTAARQTSTTTPPLAVATPEPRSLKGRVVDPRNKPVSGVQVRVPKRAVMLTDGKGEFDIRGLPATERLAVGFSAPGFMDTTRIYNTGRLSTGTTVVVIWPRTAPALLDAERGGKLSFPDGTVNFPPRALVDERGQAVRGKVKVSLSALDISDRRQLGSAPGDFTARMRDNTVRQLETFGVFEVFAETADRRRANLARGRSVTVELSIPEARRRTAPETVGLFSFDQNSGRWVEEGRLRRARDSASFITSLNTVYPVWNADQVLDTTCLRVQVVDEFNQPAPNTPVTAEGLNYYGTSPTVYTDATGIACLLVKQCADVNVVAHHQSSPDVQSCPQKFSTHCYVSDCSNPSACPLETATVKMEGGSFQDDLNSYDQTRWHKSDGTNYVASDPTNPFGSGWLPSHITHAGGIMTLQLDDAGCPTNCHNMPYASGEYQSTACYFYGKYEASIKAAKEEGVVTTFFTYTGPYGTPAHHEIDIEIKGKQETCTINQPKTVMQANYFVRGKGQHEKLVDLCFDASAAFHTYAFEWRPGFIQWSVDGQVVHTVYQSKGVPLPSLPGKIIVSLWAGNANATSWLGTFNYTGTPVTAEYDWIKYSP